MRRMMIACVVAALIVASITSTASPASAAIADCSAFVTYSPTTKTWSMANSDIRKDVQLTSDGRFVQSKLRNLISSREMMTASDVGGEFQIVKSSPRTEHRGDVPGWVFDAHDCSLSDVDGDASPDRADLWIRLHNATFEVTARYRVWKGNSLIEQSFDYRNVSGAAIVVEDPLILNGRSFSSDIAAGQLDVTYFTGGENTPTALQPQTFVPNPATQKDLQTTFNGSREFLPEIFFRNRVHNDGLLMGWSYTGGTFVRMQGNGTTHVDAYGANGRTMADGEQFEMSTGHIMAFVGDLDDAGNRYKNFQYRYKWDVTNDAWVGGIKPYDFPAPWNPATGNLSKRAMFDLTQTWREMGASIWHLDAGWHGEGGNLQYTGNWLNTTGADLGQLGSYSSKSGMGLMVWLPPWDAAEASGVYTSNPTWRVPATTPAYCEWGGGSLRMDSDAAVAWMRSLLMSKSAEFGGSWIWRQDMGGSSFDGPQINPIKASRNYFKLMEDFRADNPSSGINVNMCGGSILNLETVRQSDFAQVTDGAPGQWSNWTPSYLYPADKFWGGSTGTDHASIVGQLQRGMEWNGWTTSADPALSQLLTKYAETMRFMKSIGLAGRWSQLYHPEVVNEDKHWFVQRMNSTNTAGVIIPARDKQVASGVTVYPKGLKPATSYSVKFQNSGYTATNTGAHWMTNGITTTNWGGDLVWLNVTNYPGSAVDSIPPSAPASVSKSTATEMTYPGVAITWPASTDNVFVSRYEVLRNGHVAATTASSRYVFIEGGALSDTYEVRAVDGDGNRSALAAGSPGLTSTTAASAFARTQGSGGWRYDSLSGASPVAMAWDARQSRWDGNNFALVGSNWQHPGSTTDSARTWVSGVTGTATVRPSSVFLTGDVDGPDPMQSGDGVRIRILRDGVQVWPASGWQTIAPIQTLAVPSITVSVVPGTRLTFVVNRNGHNLHDTTRWNPTVDY